MRAPVPLADIYAALRKACRDAGGQGAFAASIGISPQYLCDLLMARREPTDRILNPLGFRRRTIYERVKT